MKKFLYYFLMLLLLMGLIKINVVAYEGMTGMGCKLPTFESNENKNSVKKEKKLKNKQKNTPDDCQLEFEKIAPEKNQLKRKNNE